MITIPSMVTATMRANAALGSTTGGAGSYQVSRQAYEDACSVFHWQTGTMVCLMRVSPPRRAPDQPAVRDFELRRYLALSLSFRQARPAVDPTIVGSLKNLAGLGIAIPKAPFDHALALVWVHDLFQPNADRGWYEPAVRDDQDEAGAMHWRLFCDPDWHPIRPPVDYHAELVRRGWKTWDMVKSGYSAAG